MSPRDVPPAPRRVRVIGIGPGGVDQVTVEAIEAMRSVAAFLVVEKREDDPLVLARERLVARHVREPPPVIVVPDVERDRGNHDADSYLSAVTDWHAARAERYREAILSSPGDVGILVWGDPAFYDSTVRILDRVAESTPLRVDVIPGVSSLQLLAARHRIVLHEIGGPLHLTTGRRLAGAIEAGQRNIAAMLLSNPADLEVSDGWRVWWGANLGTDSEALASGTTPEVIEEIETHRARVKDEAGWVMDLALMRGPA